jgi:hypothetical protein
MSVFNTFFVIISLIFGLIFSAVLAAFFSIFSAFVLQLLTRFIARFKLSYLTAYGVSFLSWFVAFIFQAIGSLLSYKFETVKIPGFLPNSTQDQSIYPPGTIPYSTYIAVTLALLVISIIYAVRIQHPDTGPIGIFKGFLIALSNAALFILFVMLIVGYIAFIGP